MLRILFIRHSKTYGNTLGRYIGTTDESLCEEGIELLQSGKYPDVDIIYASPMQRCCETADLIFPNREIILNAKLKECDFGDFENKNYKELDGNRDYQAWVDSGGTLPFPNGESHEKFQARCCEGFREVVEDARLRGCETMALVVHGGTIMSILAAYSSPKEEFYHWQAKNGRGYWATLYKEGEMTLHEIDNFSPFTGLPA